MARSIFPLSQLLLLRLVGQSGCRHGGEPANDDQKQNLFYTLTVGGASCATPADITTSDKLMPHLHTPILSPAWKQPCHGLHPHCRSRSVPPLPASLACHDARRYLGQLSEGDEAEAAVRKGISILRAYIAKQVGRTRCRMLLGRRASHAALRRRCLARLGPDASAQSLHTDCITSGVFFLPPSLK